jgi:formylmethanofuran dehydrogenase subunit B
VSLAERVGAYIDPTNTGSEGAVTGALQSVGEVTCTLGEVRNRADLVIVWRSDPAESHPRLFSRYALDPVGAFLPGGRSDRYCVVVDARESRSVREAADQFISITDDGEFDALWTLRALARGIEVDPAAVESATGVPMATWQGLMDRMRVAKYGVLFYDVGASAVRDPHSISYAVHSLVGDMNSLTRFVCMPLRGGGNPLGALNVLTWRTGYPSAVSFARGYPGHRPGDLNAYELLRTPVVDAALITSADPMARGSIAAYGGLQWLPRIVLSSDSSIASGNPTVFFRTAEFGVSVTGSVYRMDGVPLPLRGVLPSPFPSTEGILRAIGDRVRSMAAADSSTPRESDSWR